MRRKAKDQHRAHLESVFELARRLVDSPVMGVFELQDVDGVVVDADLFLDLRRALATEYH